MCLHVFHHFSLTFQCFKDVFHYFSLYCWVDFMHILHICSTWKTRDGRKFDILEFWGLQDYINRVRMPSRICLGVSGLNK